MTVKRDLAHRPPFGAVAHHGTYFIYFLEAAESYGTMAPASTASLISREATALFFSSIPKRSRSDVFVKERRITYFRQA
jgi:hypothetical protein